MVYPHLIQSTFMPGIAWMGSSLMEFESEKISLIKREMVRVAAEADKAKAAALAKLESDLRVALHENLSHTTGRPVVWKITLSWGGGLGRPGPSGRTVLEVLASSQEEARKNIWNPAMRRVVSGKVVPGQPYYSFNIVEVTPQ